MLPVVRISAPQGNHRDRRNVNVDAFRGGWR
jgi:hypothetical protein